jgi:hypothetical protein
LKFGSSIFPVKANKEQLCKNLIPYNRKIKASQTLLIQELKNIEAKPPQLILDIRKMKRANSAYSIQ